MTRDGDLTTCTGGDDLMLGGVTVTLTMPNGHTHEAVTDASGTLRVMKENVLSLMFLL